MSLSFSPKYYRIVYIRTTKLLKKKKKYGAIRTNDKTKEQYLR